jgi:uncharacterized protein YjiS (DUF1127 family)
MLNKLQTIMLNRRAVRELHSLSDHQLRDMGISRADIKSRVYGKG